MKKRKKENPKLRHKTTDALRQNDELWTMRSRRQRLMDYDRRIGRVALISLMIRRTSPSYVVLAIFVALHEAISDGWLTPCQRMQHHQLLPDQNICLSVASASAFDSHRLRNRSLKAKPADGNARSRMRVMTDTVMLLPTASLSCRVLVDPSTTRFGS